MDRKEKVKGYGPEHVYNTLGYTLKSGKLIYISHLVSLLDPTPVDVINCLAYESISIYVSLFVYEGSKS